MANKKMKDWSPYVHYWQIFKHLSMAYRAQIRFGPEFDKGIKKHVAHLKKQEKRTNG